MWHARLSRREFIELCLGSQRAVEGKLQRATTISTDAFSIHAYWQRESDIAYLFPNLVVVPDGELDALFTTINASSIAPTPITSICRVITQSEATQYLDASHATVSNEVLPLAVALSMAEAALHSDGRIGISQVNASMCKRTLSYAWGRALAHHSYPEAFSILPKRWLEVHQIINSEPPSNVLQRTVASTIHALEATTKLRHGIPAESRAGAMAYALSTRDEHVVDAAWRELARFLRVLPPSLGQLATATREERGTYLQLALREAKSVPETDIESSEVASAACAFIATQVAPGSLEHFELLRSSGRPDALLWYALYAALQSPNEVLTGQHGLGRRLLRDIVWIEDQLDRPRADIAFAELKALERVGIASVARKLGHISEVEVELIPFVTSSFTYLTRSQRVRDHAQQQLSLESEQETSRRVKPSTKVRMTQLLAQLMALVNEIPEKQPDPPSYGRQKSRKK